MPVVVFFVLLDLGKNYLFIDRHDLTDVYTLPKIPFGLISKIKMRVKKA